MAKIAIASALSTMVFLVGCASMSSQQAPHPTSAAAWAALAKSNTDALSTTIELRSGGQLVSPDRPKAEFVNSVTRQLTASIDKRTGDYRIGIFVSVSHWNLGWANFRRATFLGNDGQATDAGVVHKVDSIPDCNPSYCTYRESAVVFVEPAELFLAVLKKKNQMTAAARWPVRFVGTGRDIDVEFDYEEIEGFLNAASAISRSIKSSRPST